ncbi:MAG: hypothetical protein AABW82_00950 [Nanoarchaeota archaeon]
MVGQDTSGIWIERVAPLIYQTFLREVTDNLVGFIPFVHSYPKRYLGSLEFLDMSTGQFHIDALQGMNKGLVSHHFYPLGGTPSETKPELLGKGLARKIELEIAKDLLIQFSEDTPIAVVATSENRINYCRKVGLTPFQPMPLREYHDILQRSIR